MAVPGPKRKGDGLETKVFTGKSGTSYIVNRTTKGSFHVFMEVEAGPAAEDCGASKSGGAQAKWKSIWNGH